ncbi:hypothetical protein U1Q18_013443 [Sarracenia purpurea var. burkii]
MEALYMIYFVDVFAFELVVIVIGTFIFLVEVVGDAFVESFVLRQLTVRLEKPDLVSLVFILHFLQSSSSSFPNFRVFRCIIGGSVDVICRNIRNLRLRL